MIARLAIATLLVVVACDSTPTPVACTDVPDGGCPQDNGAHERMHLDIRRELEAGRIGRDQPAFDHVRDSPVQTA